MKRSGQCRMTGADRDNRRVHRIGKRERTRELACRPTPPSPGHGCVGRMQLTRPFATSAAAIDARGSTPRERHLHRNPYFASICLLYTSDAADEEDSVDLGGRRIIKKK